MNAKGWTILVIIVVLVGAIVLYWTRGDTDVAAPFVTSEETVHAVFACDAGKSIDATFMNGEATPSTDPTMPPTPGGSVQLVLSDGREITLQQTISADGARYASADESIVFWNVGNGATYMEENEDGASETTNCTVSH